MILSIILLASCSMMPVSETTDKSLSSKNAPEFLKKNIPKDAKDVEYYRKQNKDTVTYELKYEKGEHEISLTYSEDGKLIEREEDIEFSSLPEVTRHKIKIFLDGRYSKYKIHETEIRSDEENREFIDVEIIHHLKPTGQSEISFSKEGEFVREEVENFSEIETFF